MTYRKFTILFIASSLCLCCITALEIPFCEAQNREFNLSIDPASTKVLKEMDAYLSSMEAFSFHIDITDKYPSNTGEALEVKKSASLTVRRPDRLKADVKSEAPERERAFYYNGETITLFDKTDNLYAQTQAPDTTAKALDFAMDDLGFTFPVVDFVFKNLHKNLTENVLYSDYLGISKIGNTKCHFLIFNQDSIDWYLWIDAGKKPVPRKFIIVYKNDPQRSKFIAEFTKYKKQNAISEETFSFKPPKDAGQIEFLPVKGQDNEKNP
jgi:hypothetical protein